MEWRLSPSALLSPFFSPSRVHCREGHVRTRRVLPSCTSLLSSLLPSLFFFSRERKKKTSSNGSRDRWPLALLLFPPPSLFSFWSQGRDLILIETDEGSFFPTLPFFLPRWKRDVIKREIIIMLGLPSIGPASTLFYFFPFFSPFLPEEE